MSIITNTTKFKGKIVHIFCTYNCTHIHITVLYQTTNMLHALFYDITLHTISRSAHYCTP